MVAVPLTEHGVLLGTDRRGTPVRVPLQKAHATLLGASNTAEVLVAAHVQAGAGAIVLDGKGAATSRALPQPSRRSMAAASPCGRSSPTATRNSTSIASRGTRPATATRPRIEDRIASAEEPYYKAVASRAPSPRPTPRRRAARRYGSTLSRPHLENPGELQGQLDEYERTKPDARWLTNNTDAEKSALRGMAARLRTMVASEGAEALICDPADTPALIVLHDALRGGDLVVFTLPAGTYPELVPHVARCALQTISGACARIERSGRQADALVFVDEVSAFDGDQLRAGFERGRSAGVRTLAYPISPPPAATPKRTTAPCRPRAGRTRAPGRDRSARGCAARRATRRRR